LWDRVAVVVVGDGGVSSRTGWSRRTPC
jgi:hypothetical protein